MSDIFSNIDQKPNPIDESLANALNVLTTALVSSTTNISKRELKAIAILKQNKFIWNLLQDYLPYKKHVNNNFEKSLQKAIARVSASIGQVGGSPELENSGLLSRILRR